MARTGAQNQDYMYSWFAAGAAQLGPVFSYYRPSGTGNPVDPANLIGTLPVALSADSLSFKAPNLYGKAVWEGMWDGRLTQVGDYFVGPSGTYFVAAQQMLLPPVAVECNAIASFLRPHSSDDVGEIEEYGGDDASAEDALESGWPCSLLTKSRGEKSDANLPDDVKVPWFELLLPAVSGVTLKYNDVINCTDLVGGTNPQRFKVSSAEKTDMGWRILAMLAST